MKKKKIYPCSVSFTCTLTILVHSQNHTLLLIYLSIFLFFFIGNKGMLIDPIYDHTHTAALMEHENFVRSNCCSPSFFLLFFFAVR